MRIEGDVKRVGLFRLAVELGLVSFGGGIEMIGSEGTARESTRCEGIDVYQG